MVKAITKINNNFALCLDNNGVEVIAYGRGVGFGKFPCELPLDRVEKTFYDVNSKYLTTIADLPPTIIEVSAAIAEQAEIKLGCELNPNLPFSLGDHLNFAIERTKKGIVIHTPISFDIKYLYPQEYELGKDGINLIEEKIGVRLPENEAISIAMHLINAESSTSSIHSIMVKTQVISDVHSIIEEHLKMEININSYQFSRFAVHLSYLVQRLENGKNIDHQDTGMLKKIARSYPQNYICAQKIADYFESNWQWKCTNEETLYLMLHIYRIQEKTK